MAFNVAKTIMVAKREAVAGTPETLVDADFDVRMREVEFTPDIQGGDEDSKYVTGDYGEDIAISGIQGATFTNMVKVASGSAIDVAPKWAKLAEACGAVGESFVGTGYGFEPKQAGDKQTATFHKVGVSDDGTPVGLQSSTAGVMGNMTISAEGVGSPVMVNFEWKGKFSGITDVPNGSIPVLTAPDATIGAKFMNGTASIWGQELCVQSFSLNVGNTIEYLPCPSEATGILTSTIVNRQPRMEMTLFAPPASVFNPFAELTTEQEELILLSFGDWTIEIPRGQILSYSETDLNGRLAYELSIKCNRNAGGDPTMADESTWRLIQGATA
jgi:hypothetical protein